MSIRKRLEDLEAQADVEQPLEGEAEVIVWLPANGRGPPRAGEVLRCGNSEVRIYDAATGIPGDAGEASPSGPGAAP